MRVTNEWMMQHRTPAGAWNRPQLEVLGVAWPPAYGWKRALIGKDIPDETARAFERLARPPKSVRRNRALPNLRFDF